jgi:hypothetical protein
MRSDSPCHNQELAAGQPSHAAFAQLLEREGVRSLDENCVDTFCSIIQTTLLMSFF